jgi:hypothetical protein
MSQLSKKIEMLSWASRYRELERQRVQSIAAMRAADARRADEALLKKQDQLKAADTQWSLTMAGENTFDLFAGQLWRAEYVRCAKAELEAAAARNDAQAELTSASALFQRSTGLAERTREDYVVAKKKGLHKREEQRLLALTDMHVISRRSR